MTTKRGAIDIGPLSPSKAGRHYFPPKPVFDAPARVANATTREVYTPPQWWTRPGSDHSHLRSRGLGC